MPCSGLGGVCAVSDDPTPACEDYLRHDEFQQANSAHVPHLDPCKLCFPHGEIDLPVAALLTSVRHSYVVHRREGTGPLSREANKSYGTKLATQLDQDDVTDFEDIDPDVLTGAPAGGES